jgi:hypothetical protein
VAIVYSLGFAPKSNPKNILRIGSVFLVASAWPIEGASISRKRSLRSLGRMFWSHGHEERLVFASVDCWSVEVGGARCCGARGHVGGSIHSIPGPLNTVNLAH